MVALDVNDTKPKDCCLHRHFTRICLIVIIVFSCYVGYLLNMRNINHVVFGVVNHSPLSSTSLPEPLQQAQHNHNVQYTVSRKTNPTQSLVFDEFYTLPYYHESPSPRRSEMYGTQFNHEVNQSSFGLLKPTVKTKLILFYNHPKWIPIAMCEAGVHQCPIKECSCSGEPKRMSEADAVIVDLVDLRARRPPPRFPNQVWIAFGLESPVNYHTSHHSSKRWRHDVFNWTMTYRLDSDVVIPYDVLIRLDDVPNRNFTEIALRKSKSAAWMVSNCGSPSKRREYVEKLQQYYSVDIYGDCGSFKCKRSKENDCMDLLKKNYKFYIAFENSLCKDYITEKLFKTFDIDIVPIVRGGADYSVMIPTGTYINTADYSSPKKLAEYLQYLERNVTAYSDILRRKSRYVNAKTARKPSSIVSGYCDICMKLHSMGNYTNSYHDNVNWLREEVCHDPKDLS